MEKLLKIIKRMLELQKEAGRNHLMLGVRLYGYEGKEYLELSGYYWEGIRTLCGLIKKKDLKNLTWLELHILIEATNRKDKLRKWVFERQKSFPFIISEKEIEKQTQEFEAIYSQELLEICSQTT